jgi:hypothetical protein
MIYVLCSGLVYVCVRERWVSIPLSVFLRRRCSSVGHSGRVAFNG